jgi:hypothetical protein
MFHVEQLFHVKQFGCFELWKYVRTCAPPAKKRSETPKIPTLRKTTKDRSPACVV